MIVEAAPISASNYNISDLTRQKVALSVTSSIERDYQNNIHWVILCLKFVKCFDLSQVKSTRGLQRQSIPWRQYSFLCGAYGGYDRRGIAIRRGYNGSLTSPKPDDLHMYVCIYVCKINNTKSNLPSTKMRNDSHHNYWF